MVEKNCRAKEMRVITVKNKDCWKRREEKHQHLCVVINCTVINISHQLESVLFNSFSDVKDSSYNVCLH